MKFILNTPQAREEAIAYIESLDMTARPVLSVEIKPYKKERTQPQNAYYFGVVLKTVSDYTGFTKEELHVSFKRAFLPIKREMIGGVMVEILTSTKELDTLRFNEYLEHVARFCAETIGVYIPMPNELMARSQRSVTRGNTTNL